MKKFISLILVVVSLFLLMSIPVYADTAEEDTVTVTVNDIDFIFDAATSEDFRNKAIAHYFNHDNDGAETYGLTCTLFGHKLESSLVTTVTHKKSSTDPRCLQEKFNVETCSRCNYSSKTLISSTYISCC